MKKRIALAVVAAVAGGLLAAAPASAAVTGTLTLTGAAGSGRPDTVFSTGSFSYAVTQTIRVGVIASADIVGTTLKATWLKSAETPTIANTAVTSGAGTYDTPTAATSARVFSVVDTATDTAGLYGVRFWADLNGDTVFDATTEPSVDYNYTVGGTAAEVSIAFAASTVSAGAALAGTISFVDGSADEFATTKSTTGWALYDGTNTIALDTVSTPSPFTGTYTFVSNAAARVTGTYYLTVSSTKFGTGTASLSVIVASETATDFSVASAAGIKSTAGTALTTNGATDALTVDTAVTSLTFKTTGPVSDYGKYESYTVSSSNTSNVLPASAKLVKIGADGSASFTITNAAPANLDTYKVAIARANKTVTYTVNYAKPVSTPVATPASATVAVAATTPISVRVADQWDRAVANATLIVSVAGRNPQTATLTADASGVATFSLTDKSSLSTTDASTDTVSFSYTNASAVTKTGTATITYSATAKVPATVVVTALPVGTPVSAGKMLIDQTGVALKSTGNVVKYLATVKDAAGAPVPYAVVTFSAGADDIFTLDKGKTVVTGSDGVASAYVYRHKAGAAKVSAKAGTITSVANGDYTWVNTDGGGTNSVDARNLTVKGDPTAVVTGSVLRVIATVTDAYGNPVKGVNVTFAESGAGRWDAGNTAATGTDGTAAVDLKSTTGETGKNIITASITSTGNQSQELAAQVTSNGVVYTVTGAPAGNYEATTTVEFTAAASAAADPTVTALVTQVQSLIVSVNAIIASMTKSITATNSQIAKLVAAIAKLTKKK